MAPWTEQSPLAAALGAATGYFQGKKEKEQLAYDRGEQAKKDAYLAAQTAALIAANKPITMPWGPDGSTSSGTTTAASGSPVAGPSATGGVTTAPTTPAAPGTKTLGTVTAHATRKSIYPGEQDLETKQMHYNALLQPQFVGDPRYHDAIATMRQAYQDAVSAKESWISDQMAIVNQQRQQLETEARINNWTQTQKDAQARLLETKRHDLADEWNSMQNSIRSTSTASTDNKRTIEGAMQRVKVEQAGSNRRQQIGIKALGAAAGAPDISTFTSPPPNGTKATQNGQPVHYDSTLGGWVPN